MWELVLKEDKIEKEHSPILESLDEKKRKRVKKTLQTAEPTEYFGQDFTQLGELIDMLKELQFIKSDEKMVKRFKSIDERNIDMLALSSNSVRSTNCFTDNFVKSFIQRERGI